MGLAADFALVHPSYVLAYTYTYLLKRGGTLELTWQSIAGSEAVLFSPFSFAGAVLVLALNTFPFVYLLARSALKNFNVSFEEVARTTGANRVTTFVRVSLPLMRPSLIAGLFLAILYVASDFGAVSLLRFQTFTYAVYQQMTGRFDNTAAACLSLVLLFVRSSSCSVNDGSGSEASFTRPRAGIENLFPNPAVPSRPYFYGLPGSGVRAAFGLPVLLLIQWTVKAAVAGEISHAFIGYAWNSVSLSGLTATAAVVCGIPLAYLACRHRTRAGTFCVQGAYTGYVLPGPVAALAVLVLVSQTVPQLYGTILVLLMAYLVHFLPAALQGMESTLQQLTPNLEEAARSLGARSVRTFFHVTLPLVRADFWVPGSWCSSNA